MSKTFILFYRGQVSFEWLLIAAAFFAVLALFVPLFQTVFSGGLFGIDALKAKAFSDSFQQKTALLNVLGNGSRFSLSATPSRPWKILLHENQLEVVLNPETENEKRLARKLSLQTIPIELVFSGSFSLVLEKQNGYLMVNRE